MADRAFARRWSRMVVGWEAAAARRLRFVLDFAYATGLRAGELVSATLGDVLTDANGDHWLRLVGKGSRPGKVALPPLARHALDQSLLQRGLPVTPVRWQPKVPLLARLAKIELSDRPTNRSRTSVRGKEDPRKPSEKDGQRVFQQHRPGAAVGQ